MAEKDLWKSVLEEIKITVNSASFSAWFANLKLIRIKDNRVLIQVPMIIHKSVLAKNYYNLMDDAFYKLTNQNYEFEFLLEDEIDESILPTKVEIVDNVDNFSKIDTISMNKVDNYEEEWTTNLDSNLNFDNYLVGDSNRLAKTAGLIVAEQPGKVHNPLFIYGKSGLGKTHLMQAIGNYIVNHSKKKVLYATSEMFKDDYVNISNTQNVENNIQIAANFKRKYRDVDVLIIDDIQFISGKEGIQEEFFNTFNTIRDNGGQIILTSDRPPKEINPLTERLRSRFLEGLLVDISNADYETRLAILRQKVQIDNIVIDDIVLSSIATKIDTNIRELEGTLNKIVAQASLTHSPITFEFAEKTISDVIVHKEKAL